MRDQSGFTLVELMVVVALVGIILAMATLNFNRMNEKYTLESNIKEIYAILMKARNDASNTNTPRLVVLAANQVQTGADADEDNVIDAGTAATTPYPRFTISAANIGFNRRGLTNNLQTIRITGYSTGTAPAMDCIVVAQTRINIGLWTGGKCVQR